VAAADFEEHFDGPELDRSVWLPHYLPAWSSREVSAADYMVERSSRTLRILPEQGLWCAAEHQPPLRVSGIQSGNHSGPVASSVGQQPFREGLRVKEEQEPFWGWTPCLQRVEVTAPMELSPMSMASAWLIGRELGPRESAEVCIFEIFSDAVEPGRFAEVGTGLHAFRDPYVPEDFLTTRVELDVSNFHTYAVDWGADEVTFWEATPITLMGSRMESSPPRALTGSGRTPVVPEVS
jgi:hypothetical protein